MMDTTTLHAQPEDITKAKLLHFRDAESRIESHVRRQRVWRIVHRSLALLGLLGFAGIVYMVTR